MRVAAASAPDPFLPASFSAVVEIARAGKVRAAPSTVSASRTGAFILAGQSLAAGASEGLYTPTNHTAVDNLDQLTGEILKGADPLIGAALETNTSRQACPFTRVADQLITAGDYDRVVLVPAALGGTTVAQWDSTYYTRIVNAYLRAAAAGLTVDAIFWQLGETDNGLGTSQVSYTNSFNSMKAKVVAAGCSAPWIIAKSTYIPGGSTSSAIRAAIDALLDGTSIFAGPDCDTLNSSNRYDDQHWNTTGNAACAALWTTAIQAAL